MKIYVLLLLVLGCTHIHGAPVGQDDMTPGSCDDPHAVKAAHLALSKINQDRQEGYIFTQHRLSNVHLRKHTETGVVYYLDIDVVETICSVVSRKDWKDCEARDTSDTPVYGVCRAAIYIDKVNRVMRLYKYNCAIRPAPAARISQICPDCPTFISTYNAEVQKTVSHSLEKFNKESGLNNHFALLKVTRARAGYAMRMYYNVEYTIQETTCTRSAGAADKCDFMTSAFARKGFCKASLFYLPTDEDISVECEIYDPEVKLIIIDVFFYFLMSFHRKN
ncbi:fetuin-B-like [Leuresthes tenuis]|uniref:fetuin-B-like n=1 Tax=Leuresthes tenuis TaxID=355514 RepID=UPI003B50B248